ncbi:MAG: peptide ABC transporter substrate-binding protein [Clostridia bacterium]|nr:peptide ABC transporter substrate-binding protein [Clostridia bacterium]
MKKFIALVLVAIMALSMVAACTPQNQGTTTPTPADPTKAPEEVTNPPAEETPAPTPFVRPTSYVRAEDEDIYNMVLGQYEELMKKAAAGTTADEKFVLYAQAEAFLLSTGVMIPTTTQGGAYAITRVAPRSIPYANWGNDDDRIHSIVIATDFIKKEDRAEMLETWSKAMNGEGTYDPAAILTGKGYKLHNEYATTFSTAPVTIDWLNTSSQSDTEITVNTVEGLVEYDNLGVLQPALAERWEESADGLTYTFHIRKGVKWYTSEGREVAEVTAHDFVAGFQHMLDCGAGLEFLVDGKVVGVHEYIKEGGSWDEVGYKATDDYTLVVTLKERTTYFMTMLTYSCFLPICKSFYESRGGVFGIEEYAEAVQDTNKYTFGLNTDISSQVYCGPFLLQKLNPSSEILVVKNDNYWNKDKVTLNSIKWVYDDGSNPLAFYRDTVNGVYPGVTLGATNGLLEEAKKDGNFDKYGYITDTTSTTYFGGLNLNRGTYQLESGACASTQTEDQKIDTHIAMLNQNFRLAVQYSFDKETYNAVSKGQDLALTSLRNMYTQPEFVFISTEQTDADGHTFPANTFYGDMVQYYVKEKYNMPIDVHDGVNGWFHPTEAKQHLEKAIEELGDAVTWPIHIDVVYLGTSESNTNQAHAYKAKVEETLGADRVVVDLIKAENTDEFYPCGYRASNGEAGNFDMFYGSGWGPDYGDPSTYLETFLGMNKGYMTKVIGLF